MRGRPLECRLPKTQKFKLQRVLGHGGAVKPPAFHTISCLGSSKSSSSCKLIREKFFIKGHLFTPVIDSGATTSFIPSQGQIIKKLNPQKQPANIMVQTADNGLVQIKSLVTLPLQPEKSTAQPHDTELLIVDSLTEEVLGCDLVVGLPLLYSCSASLCFDTVPVTVKWPTSTRNDTHHRTHNAVAALTANKIVIEDSEKQINQILEQYSSVFADQLNGSVIDQPPVLITLAHRRPIATKHKNHAPEEALEIDRRLYENDIIEEANSEYSANCKIVPKKTGKSRLVVNYVPLNVATIRDRYPMPNLNDMFLHLYDASFFSAMDATEGFHQLVVHPDDRKYLAFSTPSGFWQYKKLPFGFKNSPGIFQRCMDNIFGTRCLVYVDDILVHGRTAKEHNDNLRWVLTKCEQYNLKINRSKCRFLQTETTFLGRRISSRGIEPILDHLDHLKNNLAPTNKDHLRSLIGSLVFHSRFIPSYSELTQPLNTLLRKEVQFQWTDENQKALAKIRSALQNATPQTIPSRENRTKPSSLRF